MVITTQSCQPICMESYTSDLSLHKHAGPCKGIIIVDSHTAVSLTSMVTSSSSHDPGVGLLQL